MEVHPAIKPFRRWAYDILQVAKALCYSELVRLADSTRGLQPSQYPHDNAILSSPKKNRLMRTSEFNLQRLANGPASLPTLELERAPEGGLDVVWVTPISYAKHIEKGQPIRAKILNIQENALSIWPIHVNNPTKPDFLQPKYGNLSRIIVASRRNRTWAEEVSTVEGVIDELEQLPDGFEKNFVFGLGLRYEYRFICEAVATVPGVTTLVVHGNGGRNDYRVEGPLYFLGELRFHAMRKQLNAATARYQGDARRDKIILTPNTLLHPVDGIRFPVKRKMLRRDQLSEIASDSSTQITLSNRDGRAAARLVRQNVAAISQEDPATLLELKADIERVTMFELIGRFEVMLGKPMKERKWQDFFKANPFILTMVIGAPAIVIEDTPYFGGKRFDNTGGRYGDFLLAARSTRNATIVEIKTPETELLDLKREYREGVHGPSVELGGALSQVLDQRQELQSNIYALNAKTEERKRVESYAVRCVILAGRTPQSLAGKKSFEFLRNAISDVSVVTFDELLERLKEIQHVLNPPALEPPF